jgi:E3 ubiquitin-protein ligase RNF144
MKPSVCFLKIYNNINNRMLMVGTVTLTVATDTPIEDPVDIIDPIDPKGKQPVEFTRSYSIAEQGGSSKVIHDTFYCPICMEAVQTKDGFNIKPCEHIFCTNCMVNYINVKAKENATSIPCPTPDCEITSVDPTTFQHLLSKDVFDRWCLGLFESSLGMKKFYCPFKDCSALLIHDGGEIITYSECPHCKRMFCARCNVPWHGDISCEEFEKLGDDEKGRDDLMLRDLAKDKRWQRCPKCRMFVEKIDGCKFMKCRFDLLP